MIQLSQCLLFYFGFNKKQVQYDLDTVEAVQFIDIIITVITILISQQSHY